MEDRWRRSLSALLVGLLGCVLSVILQSSIFSSTIHQQLTSSDSPCTTPNYTVHILAYDPLMIHIEGFLSEGERRHLLQLAYARADPFVNTMDPEPSQ